MDDKRQASACITLTASRWAGCRHARHVGPYGRTGTYGTHRSQQKRRDEKSDMQENRKSLYLSVYIYLSRSLRRAVLRSTAFIVVGSFFPHHITQHNTTCSCRTSPSLAIPLCVSARFIDSSTPRGHQRMAYTAPPITKQGDRRGRRPACSACTYGAMLTLTRPLWVARFSLKSLSARPNRPTEAHHTTPDQSVKRNTEGTSQ